MQKYLYKKQNIKYSVYGKYYNGMSHKIYVEYTDKQWFKLVSFIHLIENNKQYVK